MWILLVYLSSLLPNWNLRKMLMKFSGYLIIERLLLFVCHKHPKLVGSGGMMTTVTTFLYAPILTSL